MAKKNASQCAKDAIFSAVKVLPKDAMPIAKEHLTEMQQLLSVKDTTELTQRLEAAGIAGFHVGKQIQEIARKGEKFDSLGRIVATAPNTEMYLRDARIEGLITHHTMASAYSDMIGLVRGKRKGNITKDSIDDFITRASLQEAFIRSMHIPIVINKPASAVVSGPMHYSHLGLGDIGRVFHAVNKKEILGSAILNSLKATQNIQFQNIAEAARRVIEESVTKPDTLDGAVREALTRPIGKPNGAANKKLLDEAMAWANSPEGIKIVDNLVEVMTDPKFIERLVAEDTKMMMVNLALSQADGWQIASKLLESVSDLAHRGEKLKGYGALLYKNGVRKAFQSDALVKLQPDNITMGFAENAIAKFFAAVDGVTHAVIKETHVNATGIEKDVAASTKGKSTKANRNKAKQETAKDISNASDEQVAHEMQNEPFVEYMAASEEESKLSRKYYLENYYGSMVGGLAKAISKVSDIATMGSEIKTRLMGIEGRRIENAAIMTASLRKFADSHGQDISKFNSIFRALQNTTDETMAATIAGMPEADQKIATELADFIDGIYGQGEWNTMIQAGVHLDEMVASLRLVGQGAQADILKNSIDPLAAKDFWKQLELKDGDNIVEILSKYYSALQLSQIKPALASSLSLHFSHLADNLTYEEAIKQGYKPLTGSHALHEFIQTGEKPALFHPEIIGRIESLNHYLNYQRSFNGGMQKFINQLDPIVSILKSSNTIWRPGHHLTNIIGETFMNLLAGVYKPRHYAMAVKLMKQNGLIDHLDETAMEEILRSNIPAGYVFQGAENGVKIALKDPKTGKVKNYILDFEGVFKGASGVAGVVITPRRAKDVIENEAMQNTVTNVLMKNPISKGISTVDHKLARFSAARDNVSRLTHFIKELEEAGPFNSLEEAFYAAGDKVHQFHPTVGSLTAAERKYARRLFYFYTWQKQAFFKILDLIANSPAVITTPSKVQFAIAESQGINPESYGKPFDPTQLFAAYNTNTVYGPQFNTPYGQAGYKPSITQLDVIDSYLSQFQTKPGAGLWENMGNMAQTGLQGAFLANATPIVKMPAELITGNKFGDKGKVTDIPQYLLDQTGVAALSRYTGQTPWGQRTDYKTDAFAAANRDRVLINYLFGLKLTYYQSPTALDTARQERVDYFKRINHNGN